MDITVIPTSAMPEDHVEWCKAMFAMLAEGGVWGVPRSAISFRKEGGALVLDERFTMPWSPGLPITEEELREQQDAEFEQVREHFEAAGIEVRR